MTTARRIIAGNWKMNGLETALIDARAIASWLDAHPVGARVALCPPATLLSRMAEALAGTGVEIGGQDCSPERSGAFTGDVSALMLLDAGARLVIVGHSERRAKHWEENADVAAKAKAAADAGLEPIVCVGETLEERRNGHAVRLVCQQVEESVPQSLAARAFAVAYEPIWAIGSGLTPRIEEIVEMHIAIRETLEKNFAEAGTGVPILYGGSVKSDNARDILKGREVGGALVGGASLTADSFTPILAAI
ncbi:MAG TPA: triose-phosphate isomerase [Caulobacteraceae bacterium]|nr:triose-phosphate isomerase [Caulobacteraceae bacterium]